MRIGYSLSVDVNPPHGSTLMAHVKSKTYIVTEIASIDNLSQAEIILLKDSPGAIEAVYEAQRRYEHASMSAFGKYNEASR